MFSQRSASTVALCILQACYSTKYAFLQVIEQAAQNGELTPLVLVVIRNRLELARHDVLLLCILNPDC